MSGMKSRGPRTAEREANHKGLQTVIAVATVDDRAIIYDIRNSKVFYISICYRFEIWGLAFLLT